VQVLNPLRPPLLVSAGWIGAAVWLVVNEVMQRRIYGQTWKLHDVLFACGPALACSVVAPAIFVASRRWPFTGPRLARRLLLHLAMSLLFWMAVAVLYQGVLAFFVDPHATEDLVGAGAIVRGLSARALMWLLGSLPIGVAAYAAGVGMEHSIRHFVEARQQEVQMARLSEQLSEARLSALQAHLNPHFLFNTLNTVTVLVRDGDRDGATRIIEQLSNILRRSLGERGTSEVALEEELAFVQQYLAIEQARFSDRLRAEVLIDPAVRKASMPSFALQHLVENAVRHGISRSPDAGRIRISARQVGGMLELVVTDDGIGFDERTITPKGRGIENTRERLQSLYSGNASLQVRPMEAGGTMAVLRVPFRETAQERGYAG
jgi:signal transduction histidine kinase